MLSARGKIIVKQVYWPLIFLYGRLPANSKLEIDFVYQCNCSHWMCTHSGLEIYAFIGAFDHYKRGVYNDQKHGIEPFRHNPLWCGSYNLSRGCMICQFLLSPSSAGLVHDDVIKWKHFPRYWSLVGGIQWSQKFSSHEVFFDMRLNKRMSKQSRRWWFETPSHSLWCHSNNICGARN